MSPCYVECRRICAPPACEETLLATSPSEEAGSLMSVDIVDAGGSPPQIFWRKPFVGLNASTIEARLGLPRSSRGGSSKKGGAMMLQPSANMTLAEDGCCWQRKRYRRKGRQPLSPPQHKVNPERD